MAVDLYLAPVPKKLSKRGGSFNITGDDSSARFIRLEGPDPQALIPAAEKTGLGWEISASPRVPKDRIGLVIKIDEESGIPDQGYKLSVKPDRMEIIASTPAGAFYGASTIAQIIRQTGDEIPCLLIEDSPDIPDRGIMLDISRDKVPTMETLYHLVDLMADWKLNQLQLYTEHTFAYLAHPQVWEKASPMTGEEIMALDKYCRERFIELVPNQNSFGHMTRWLIHDKYRPMAEAPNGCDTIWGYFKDPFSLCPQDKRSLPFVASLFEELLPHFTSTMFNVGCDETVDLGRGRSEKACKERGTGRVYMDFLLEIYKLVTQHGKTMQFWGDIIMHHPELIPELPQDTIALEWGYEFDHPFEDHCAKFAESRIPFYVCPGTGSWNSLCGRTDNALENITNSVRNGQKQGAIGFLNTDWGDCGHWQPLSVSYLGYLAGAMGSWNAKPDVKKTISQSLSIHAFGDTTGKSGQLFYDMGNLYKSFKARTFNHTVPWRLIGKTLEDKSAVDGLSAEEFETMKTRLAEMLEESKGAKMTSPDAAIVSEEIKHLQKILEVSADSGLVRLGESEGKDLEARIKEMKKSHEHVWLLRNRPGGLEDSTARMVVG